MHAANARSGYACQPKAHEIHSPRWKYDMNHDMKQSLQRDKAALGSPFARFASA
jgi:hypothetical protein